MKENGSTLSFNFISLPNPTVDKNHLIDISLENDDMYDVLIDSDLLQNFTEHSHFHITALFFVFDTCVIG